MSHFAILRRIALNWAILGLVLSSFSVNSGYGQLADTPWPMFHRDWQHTGQSPNTGPTQPVLKWAFSTGSMLHSSPAIGADGTIYVGSRDYKFYALSPDGTLKWSFPTGSYIDSSPAIGVDGTIYVGSWDGTLYALNPDGTLQWSFSAGGAISASSPVIGADGIIYVGARHGKLHAINSDGTQAWEYVANGGIDSSPALGTEGTVYFGALDGNLYAVNSNGTLAWSFSTGGPISSSPAVGEDGTSYVGSYDSKLYALNADGTRKWEFPTGGSIVSCPGISADGTIYVGSFDGKVYALNSDGSLKWDFPTGDVILGSSPVVDTEGTIYVGSFDRNLYALNAEGTLKWNYAMDQIYASPAIGSDGTIYIGSKDFKLYALGSPVEHQLAVFYAVPSDVAYNDGVYQTLVEATLDVQAWYQVATGGLTWKLAFPEIVRVYHGQQTRQYYLENGDWWGSLPGEMSSQGLPIWSPGTVTTIWAHGAGWWAGAAQGCEGDCGLALLGVEAFPQFNNPAYSGGECPGGEGVGAWPCTPVGAYAHELGHTLGLPHPFDDPATAPNASHSVMQTHWNYPTFAPIEEQPWGFLTTERTVMRSNPFMHVDVNLRQNHPRADVVNLAVTGPIPVSDFEVQVSGKTAIFINNSVGATLFYWTFGDGEVSNEVNPSHTYPDTGTYTVILRASSDVSMMGLDSLQIKIDPAAAFVAQDPAPVDKNSLPLPQNYGLLQNYPNPFNPETMIGYQLPEAGRVSLKIYNLIGREIRTLVEGEQPAGYHQVKWDGKNDAGQKQDSGVYFYQLQVGKFSQTRKVVLLK